MTVSVFSVRFNFQPVHSESTIGITAEVTPIKENKWLIREFKVASSGTYCQWPELLLEKKNGKWLHADTEKESDLSVWVGEAIDHIENINKNQSDRISQ